MDRISPIKHLRIPDLDDVFQFKLCVLQHGNTKKWETLCLIPHMHREQPRNSESNQDIKSENLPLRWHMPKIANLDPLASPQDQLRLRLDRRTRRLARIEPLGIRVDYALVPNKASNSLRIVFSSHIKFNDSIQELISDEQLSWWRLMLSRKWRNCGNTITYPRTSVREPWLYFRLMMKYTCQVLREVLSWSRFVRTNGGSATGVELRACQWEFHSMGGRPFAPHEYTTHCGEIFTAHAYSLVHGATGDQLK